MLRRLAMGLLTGSLLLIGGPAYAEPPDTTTTTTQRLTETFTDVVPACDGGGPLYAVTTTTHRVEGQTTFDDGRLHVIFTDVGTFVAVPLEDATLPTYTGKVLSTGTFNENGSSSNGTFVFSVSGTGSDGSTFSVHSVEHSNERPNGTMQEAFRRCH